jgi:hypothetical protein
MPNLTWTTQSDFEAGTLTNLDAETSPGDLLLAEGQASGTFLSEARQATDWSHWGILRISVSLPEGSNVYARIKTAATEGGLSGATWSPYEGGLADTGEIRVNVGAMLLNEGITPGAWYQVEVTMLRA